MPSSGKHPSRLPMWRGVKFAYLIVATCLFPLAIGGYWVYGNLVSYITFLRHINKLSLNAQKHSMWLINILVLYSQMPENGGMLRALYQYRRHDTPKLPLGLASLLVVINCLSSFQIYAMPVFDNLEFRYTSKWKRPCPQWLRTCIRVFFGCLAFFISVALPFLPSLAGLIGGIALPITMAYPCLMWVLIKKPQKFSPFWCLNWGLGLLGMVLSVLVTIGAIWGIVTKGIEIHFFKPL